MKTTNDLPATWENGGDEPWHATLHTDEWIAEKFEEHEQLTDDFNEFELECNRYSSHFDDGREFMESQGYYCHARDNTCNTENDFSDGFVWEVWTKNEHESDWVYADDAVCVLYLHRGGDIRGNYGGPLFLVHIGYDYSMALDWVCGFHIVEAVDYSTLAEGCELSPEECQRIDERWQIGYSSCPFSEVESVVTKWIEFDDSDQTWTAELESGERVRIGIHPPY